MSGETIKKLINEEVGEFDREKRDALDTTGMDAATAKAARDKITEEVKQKKYEVSLSFFEGFSTPATGAVFGLSTVRLDDGSDVDVKVKGRDSKGKEITLTYAEVKKLETDKLLATPAFVDAGGGLNLEGRSRLASNLVSNWAGKFEDAVIEVKAKELRDARIEVYKAAAEVKKEENLAAKEGRDAHTDSLENDKERAQAAVEAMEEKLDTFAGMFREGHQDHVIDSIAKRTEQLEQEWSKEHAHIADLAKDDLPGYLTGKFDVKRKSPTMSLEESKKEYDKLHDVSVYADDFATFKAGIVAKLAAKKQYKKDDGIDGLNEAGRAELAKQISSKVSDKKAKYFRKFEKGFDAKKKWYEAMVKATDVPESEYSKRAKAEREEAKARGELDKFMGGIPDAYKEEMELIMNGRAGAFLDEGKYKKIKDYSGFDLDDESYKTIREEAKKLKDYEKTEKARAEGKDGVSTGDGKGGNGWKYAALAAGAAVAGAGIFTGSDKVETNEKGEEVGRKSKWTFGRVIATAVGVIGAVLAIDSLARGDKAVLGKFTKKVVEGGTASKFLGG